MYHDISAPPKYKRTAKNKRGLNIAVFHSNDNYPITVAYLNMVMFRTDCD